MRVSQPEAATHRARGDLGVNIDQVIGCYTEENKNDKNDIQIRAILSGIENE